VLTNDQLGFFCFASVDLLGAAPHRGVVSFASPNTAHSVAHFSMDAASKALTEAPPVDDRTWAAREDSSGIPLTTLYIRHHGRPSKEEIAQRQQYLTLEEEKALVAFMSLMCSFGQPVRIKYIPRLAFSIAQRRTLARPNKPPGKNWAQAFEKRHPELKAKRVRSIDWKRHEIYIYDKVNLMTKKLKCAD
jgi:hypothetical protein